MTAYDLDQPKMIYTGPLPAHLLRSSEGPIEEVAEAPAAPAFAGWLRMATAAAVALVAGIAIGAVVPPLLRSAIPTQVKAAPRTTSLSPSAMAAPPTEPRLPLAAPVGANPAAVAPLAAAPQRAALALLAPRLAAATVARPIKPERTPPAAPCAAGASRADLTACADPDVAAADRDLKAAYRRALSAGAPAETAAGDQIAWMLTREDAARRSPAALTSAYRERTAQLNSLAEEPPH
jgi:uncharacterized protein YecT (DUF1311 family)